MKQAPELPFAHISTRFSCELGDSLKLAGQYVLDTVPSEWDERFLLQLEHFLQKLSVMAFRESWEQQLDRILSEALCQAAAVSYQVKNIPPNQRDEHFYQQTRKMGKVLCLVNDFFGQSNEPGA
ncbi:MAG: hypothetical protein AAF206_06315 [Bacteroidota bacterium]